MPYYTKDKRPDKKLEINHGDEIVETAGYRSAEVQISEMLNAGKRLVDYRKQRYEFGGEEVIPTDYEDPTRRPGFDMADASMLEKVARDRIKGQQEVKKVPPSDSATKVEEKPEEA